MEHAQDLIVSINILKKTALKTKFLSTKLKIPMLVNFQYLKIKSKSV